MKLVKLTVRGDVGYINADHILAAHVKEDGTAKLLLTTLDEVDCEETIEEILEQLEGN